MDNNTSLSSIEESELFKTLEKTIKNCGLGDKELNIAKQRTAFMIMNGKRWGDFIGLLGEIQAYRKDFASLGGRQLSPKMTLLDKDKTQFYLKKLGLNCERRVYVLVEE